MGGCYLPSYFHFVVANYLSLHLKSHCLQNERRYLANYNTEFKYINYEYF